MLRLRIGVSVDTLIANRELPSARCAPASQPPPDEALTLCSRLGVEHDSVCSLWIQALLGISAGDDQA